MWSSKHDISGTNQGGGHYHCDAVACKSGHLDQLFVSDELRQILSILTVELTDILLPRSDEQKNRQIRGWCDESQTPLRYAPIPVHIITDQAKSRSEKQRKGKFWFYNIAPPCYEQEGRNRTTHPHSTQYRYKKKGRNDFVVEGKCFAIAKQSQIKRVKHTTKRELKIKKERKKKQRQRQKGVFTILKTPAHDTATLQCSHHIMPTHYRSAIWPCAWLCVCWPNFICPLKSFFIPSLLSSSSSFSTSNWLNTNLWLNNSWSAIA